MSLKMDETKFGSFYIGAVFAQIFYGVVALQAYFYLLKYPKDDFKIKSLVLFLWSLATVEAAFTCHITYYYQVTGFSHPQWRSNGVWSIFCINGPQRRNNGHRAMLLCQTHISFE